MREVICECICVTSFVFVPNLRRDETARPVVGCHRLGPEGAVELVPVGKLRVELQVNDEVLARLAGSVPTFIHIELY